MRVRPRLFLFIGFATLTTAGACEASRRSTFGGVDDTTSAGGTSSATTTTAGGAGPATTGEGGFNLAGSGGSTGSGTVGASGPDDDSDKDGFTANTGDCNDCDANVNPNAVEVVGGDGAGGGGGGVPVDENCDGTVDEEPATCDAMLALDSNDPMDAARAVDLCKVSTGPKDWGVIVANWVSVDGSLPPPSANYPLGHGMLSAFGPNVKVQRGARMLGLSSGTARQPSDPGYQSVNGFSKGFTMNHPMGFPKESPSCGVSVTGQARDGAAVELKIRVPSNAHGLKFDFDFYSFEWPNYVCSMFNDFFVAILWPIPMGQTDGNISFDKIGNPVSVNNALVEVCGCPSGPPCIAGGKNFPCALGTSELLGTGFGAELAFSDHGATSWLATQAPVEPGSEISIRWGTYDSGDGLLDSTTLIDNWQWIATPGTKVGTDPVPDPE